jgi:hypothetical protein
MPVDRYCHPGRGMPELLIADHLDMPICPARAHIRRPAQAAACDAGPFWVTSHLFRKTVARCWTTPPCLPAKSPTSRATLAHPLTQDVYMARKVVSADAARMLDRYMRWSSSPVRHDVSTGQLQVIHTHTLARHAGWRPQCYPGYIPKPGARPFCAAAVIAHPAKMT